MPSRLAEVKDRFKDGGITAVLSRRRSSVPVYIPELPCKPATSFASAGEITSAEETTPHVETELEKTANVMREIVRGAILNLDTFPHGIHFKDVVWYDTQKTFSYGGDPRTGEEPRIGKIYAVATAPAIEEGTGRELGGRIQIRRAGGLPNEYGELDISSAESHPATDQEVIDYAEAIMITINRRLEEIRIKAIVDYRPLDKKRNNPDTNCLTTDLVNVDVAIGQLAEAKMLHAIRAQQPAA